MFVGPSDCYRSAWFVCVCGRVRMCVCFKSPRKDLRFCERVWGQKAGVIFELEQLFLTVSVWQQTKSSVVVEK